MKLLTLTILFSILALGLTQNLRQQHKFNPLQNLDPLQTIQLMSGDWTAILPESVRGIARSLLGKQQQSGPMDMLSKAQGLLGGGSSSNGLGSLLGGLTGGNNNQSSGSSVTSMLGGFSSLLGNNAGSGSSSSSGSSNLLSGLSQKVNGLGSLSALSGFVSHNKKESQ